MRSRFGFSLFATAIAASAVAHALVVVTFSVIPVGPTWEPEDISEMTVVFDEPKLPGAAPEFDIGQPLAKGYATHAAEGDREQVAREAPQDQPWLSLDPVGRSLVVDIPSAEPSYRSAPRPAEAPAVRNATTPPREAIDALIERVGNEAKRWSPPEPMAVAGAAQPDAPRTTLAQSGGTGADPAPKSDSEVDAFSVLGSAQFRGGRVTVRSGRQVKTRRPKIGLAGMVDLAQRSAAEVVLKVAVDASGKVTDVNVLRSSGSNEIDQPCRVAMYDWWFEPKKNATGHPVPDVFQFTISFR